MPIKIGDLQYEVILKNHGTRDGMGSAGSCSGFYQKIRIDMDERQSDGIEADLWHEIIEAVNGQYNFKFEHQTISTLASVIHQILVDNAQYFKDFRHVIRKKERKSADW
jgi:hypothetical protein